MSAEPFDRRRLRAPLMVVGAAVVLVGVLLGGMIIGRASVPAVQPPSAVTQTIVAQAPQELPLPVVGIEQTAARPPAVFTASSDLANERGRANGYRIVDTDIDRRALAKVLAGQFGLQGPVVADASGGWSVGADGGPRLSVSGNGEASWSYIDPTVGALGRVPSRERVRARAEQLLTDLGVDLGGVDWQIDIATPVTTVIAWQTLNGRRTQLAWRVSVGRRGAVTAVSGFAGALEPVPGYPVLGAAAAVARASLPGWSAIGPTPLATEAFGDPAPSDSASSVSRFSVTSPTRLGRPLAVATVSDLTFVDAELGLAQFRQPSGELLLLPAYELTASDGSRWSILAITDDYVQFEPPGPPISEAAGQSAGQ